MKVKDHIVFYDKGHKYINTVTNEQYQSFSGIVVKYSKVFTPTKSLTYKTRKRLCLTHEEVLVYWDILAKRGKYRGRFIHECIEEYIINKEVDVLNKYYTEYNPYVESDIVNETEYYISNMSNILNTFTNTEHLLYLDSYKIAGLADVVNIGSTYIDIIDWKTNKTKLTYTGYKKLLYPWNNLSDGLLTKYELQLSFYAYMAEIYYNKPIKNLTIYHLNNYKIEKYNLTYRKQDIINILNYERSNNYK